MVSGLKIKVKMQYDSISTSRKSVILGLIYFCVMQGGKKSASYS